MIKIATVNCHNYKKYNIFNKYKKRKGVYAHKIIYK